MGKGGGLYFFSRNKLPLPSQPAKNKYVKKFFFSAGRMEEKVLQNNAIQIYSEYFQQVGYTVHTGIPLKIGHITARYTVLKARKEFYNVAF